MKISRNYAISLLRNGKAIPVCYLKPNDNGDVYIAIDIFKGQRTVHFICDENDLALFIGYGEYEDDRKEHNNGTNIIE